MRKNIKFIFGLALCLGGAATHAATFIAYDDDLGGYNTAVSSHVKTEIDFENLTKGDSLTNQYSATHGMTFSSAIGNLKVDEDIFGSNPIDTLGIEVGWTSTTLSSATVVFLGVVSSVGAYFADNTSVIT